MARRIVPFSVDPSEVIGVLRGLEAQSPKFAAVALKDSGRLFDNEMRKSFRPRGSRSDQWLQSRTGNLRRSLGFQVSGSRLDDLRLAVFSAGTKYANLQENGGTIRPKRGDYLTIPIADNLTPSGVPRYPSAKDLRQQLNQVGPARPAKRGRKDKLAGARTFVLKAKTGKLYIILRQSNGKSQLLWALVKSVKVPPRFGFRRTWNKQAPMRAQMFKVAMEKAVDASIRAARRTEQKSEEGA